MHTSVRHSTLALLLTSAVFALHCSSSSTSVVTPTASKCQVSAANSPGSFSATGGSGTVTIGAARDCTWSVSADSGWISIQGPANGQGEASLPFSVQPNSSPAARVGAIVAAGNRLPVSEAGAPCRFTISRTSDSIDAAGGWLTVGVSTLSGCNWNASSDVSWISIQSGQSGSASGTVVLAISANAGATRTASVTVAGQAYTVTQDAKVIGAAPTPSPSPTPPPPPGSVTPAVVDFGGSISSIGGSCPAVTFRIKDLTVATNAATDYRRGNCGDLHNKVQVSGSGWTQPDGSVLATAITFTKD